MTKIYKSIFSYSFCLSCLPTGAIPAEDLVSATPEHIEAEIVSTIEPTKIAINWGAYPFLQSTEDTEDIFSLEEKFPTPNGYQRIELKDESFGAWLRTLPVIERTVVLSYDKRPIQAPAAAIVPIDVGRGDVQQCADSILRLYSEYRWYKEEQSSWGIHFTSGDLSTWKDWSAGKRFKISGSKVTQIQKTSVDRSYAQYQKWLHHSFLYAGTRSMHLDAKSVPIEEEIEAGAFFVTGGSPGHAILVLDVAKAEGKPTIALLGQGFMPAQEFHVLRHSVQQNLHWFVLPEMEEALHNPSWASIPRRNVYRFP
jgi:hypothetical protein